ncbi:MAG: hypothetical protein AAGC76_13845 [Luteibacter sp.]|uniref:CC0125/CC1285 family lipoprotein n=1 Tax=Luteibacter sp. TaxID=1886636 RepID=UPI00280A2998|nr:hypothetical protein [Luteibacter sp.]MDQ7996916.1 hypothetical protein [Luteibacter sp.]MDQ8049288.1 hypothetical protein [Luteibacter sp.]
MLLLMPLAGCYTNYAPKSFWNGGGFSETMLSPDVAQISFKGNGYTGDERAGDMVLLRAADLALEHGFPYVAVDGVQMSDSASTVFTPGYYQAHVVGNSVYASGVPAMPITIHSPSSRVTARFFHEQRPGVLDARFLAASIRNKYGIKLSTASGQVVSPAGRGGPAAPVEAEAPDRAPAPRADLATTVLMAQKMSERLGCGDVHSGTAPDEFIAECSDHKVVISCSQSECHPVHTQR